MSSRKRRCSLEMPQGASGLYTGWTPVIAYFDIAQKQKGVADAMIEAIFYRHLISRQRLTNSFG
jgi:hypothetical protein